MSQLKLPELKDVSRQITETRKQQAFLKKLFRVLQEAKSLGIVKDIKAPEKEVANV